MKSLVAALVRPQEGSPASRRPLARLLSLAPAALLLSGLFTVWTGPLAAPVAAATGDWAQFHNGPAHQGNDTQESVLSASNVAALGVAWTGTGQWFDDSSAAVVNGVIYIGSRDSYLYAFPVGCASDGASCAPLWKAATGGVLESSPAVINGVVYVGSADGKLYAFAVGCNTGGGSCSPIWTGATGGAIEYSSPAVVGGVIYIGSIDGKLYAFEVGCNTGGGPCSPIWTGATGNWITSSPAVAGGVVYVGSRDNSLYAFEVGCNTGGGPCSPIWTGATGNIIVSSPAVANGVVYVGSEDGKLYAFGVGCAAGGNPCAPLWTGWADGFAIGYSSPAVANDVVYIGSLDHKLLAFDAAGVTGCSATHCAPLWTGTTGSGIYSSPAVANGVVYVGSEDGKLYAYAVGCASGGGACSPLWTSAATGGEIDSSPAVANGVVYVGSWDGKLYAYGLNPLHHLVLGPSTATIAAGASQAYTALGADVGGHSLGDVTSATTFTIAGGGSCTAASCTSIVPGDHTVTGTDGSATGTATLHVNPVSGISGATYHALTPTRILDSRDGTGLAGAFSSHVARTFAVTGHGGVPAGATAVTGNLTVTQQTSQGFLSIGPNAQNNPTSSTLNFPLGDDRANAVTVALSGTGALSVTYAAPTSGPTAHVIFDVTGYFTPDATGATYHALTPSRILDSRDGTGLAGAFGSHVARTFTVTGHGGVPAGATAVTGNLTVTGQSSLGFLFMGPNAADNPTSSTLNFPLGDDRANAVTVALGAGGTLSITYAAPTLGKTAHVIFDVTGYFTQDMTGAVFVPLTPGRILDSRDGTGGLSGAFGSHVARTFTVTGHGGVPSGATAVTGNLTVTQQSSQGFLYLGPVASNNPTSSTLNFPVGDDRANAVTVALGGGNLSVTYAAPTSGPTAHAIFDVTGYFVP